MALNFVLTIDMFVLAVSSLYAFFKTPPQFLQTPRKSQLLGLLESPHFFSTILSEPSFQSNNLVQLV